VPIKVESSHLSPNQGNTPEAYERLIYDIMRCDTTLFAWWNEVEASWKLADQIISFRESQRQRFPNYTAGTTVPVKAIELLARDGREWWSV
jgi:glucose-6-phosphate 1-dehydrogenase